MSTLLLALALGVMMPAASAVPPVASVTSVDLDRYVGSWFELARYPNRFQRQCTGNVKATYAKRSDGRIDVINECRTANGPTTARGVARIVDTRSNAKLKVRFAPAALSFLPMVWGDYWIIGLAPDYSWAVVGTPDRKYLWILSRSPSVAAGPYQQALDRAAANGFDTSLLVRTSQN